MDDETLLDEAFEQSDQPDEVDVPVSTETYNLLQLGYLTSDIVVGNHKITVRTLRIGEELEAALLAEKYKDTVDAGRAMATALAAASVALVDGEPMVEPIGPIESLVKAKFDYVVNNWFWQPTIRTVYAEYNSLVVEAQEVQDDLKKD
jgi:hypothetical protein